MATSNVFNSPLFFTPNNENSVKNIVSSKQGLNSIQPKKKALSDVGNIIHHKNVSTHPSSKSFKKIEQKSVTKITGFDLKINEICDEEDMRQEFDHNWSACNKNTDDDIDWFLPNLELTPQELDSYTLDWEVKPSFKDVKKKDINLTEFEVLESPGMNLKFLEKEEEEWSKFKENYTLLLMSEI
uniref:Uncharacterized protein n=1 Tax=Clastoptera arizonana TaxID=38151 RepID=A0A1B6CPF9_9HEMI